MFIFNLFEILISDMAYFFDTNIILSCHFDVFKSLIISCQGYFEFSDILKSGGKLLFLKVNILTVYRIIRLSVEFSMQKRLKVII